MTDRERLVELIKNANATYKDDMPCTQEEFTADFLVCSGVIVPPCKVGDMVYAISTEKPSLISFGKIVGRWKT